jgi:hypothetical protein
MSIIWNLINALMFIAWIVCIAFWIKRGCPVPRWVHVMALCLFLLGIAAVGVLSYMRVFSLKWVGLCLLFPPAAAYLGWLWMFGPATIEDD